MFAQFYKDRQVWAGLALYHEVDSLAGHSRATRAAMDHGPASWADTVTDAAGKPLSQSCTSIWSTVEPTQNRHWQAKVRQVCQRVATRTSRG